MNLADDRLYNNIEKEKISFLRTIRQNWLLTFDLPQGSDACKWCIISPTLEIYPNDRRLHNSKAYKKLCIYIFHVELLVHRIYRK